MTDLFDTVPAERREVARTALAAAFGGASVGSLDPVTGGASGAQTYRATVAGRPYLLRLEGRRTAMRNPHQYTCMQIAADAGVAPRLHYFSDADGVAIMDFLPQRALAEYPGGAAGLAQAAAKLVTRLQATPLFPQLLDTFAIVGRLLAFLRGSNMFAPGLLDPHVEGFERIRAAYPTDAASGVSSHNDPNPRNMIFDGKRLWLVDWETAYRNDPLVDIAILIDQLEAAPDLEELLLRTWLGRAPDCALRARLFLMRPLTRLYYAGLALAPFAAAPREKPDADLTAPTPQEFRAAFEQGRLTASSPETLYLLGKMQLAGFIAGLSAPGFDEALIAVRNG
jgi:aminoglycoside phosphotransferase (APT) family kinase protein